jgi:hypothetical protein
MTKKEKEKYEKRKPPSYILFEDFYVGWMRVVLICNNSLRVSLSPTWRVQQNLLPISLW